MSTLSRRRVPYAFYAQSGGYRTYRLLAPSYTDWSKGSTTGQSHWNPEWVESGHSIEPAASFESFKRDMTSTSSNDNERPTRQELETANRDLRASLKRSEDLVSDCKDKLVVAYGLTLPEHTPG